MASCRFTAVSSLPLAISWAKRQSGESWRVSIEPQTRSRVLPHGCACPSSALGLGTQKEQPVVFCVVKPVWMLGLMLEAFSRALTTEGGTG